jgi:hypothetical protein
LGVGAHIGKFPEISAGQKPLYTPAAADAGLVSLSDILGKRRCSGPLAAGRLLAFSAQ